MSSGLPTLRVKLEIDAMQMYCQQVLADHADEISQIMQAELKQQLEALDIDQIVKDGLEGAVQKAIKEDMNQAFLDTWFKRNHGGARQKIRQALADSMVKFLAEMDDETEAQVKGA